MKSRFLGIFLFVLFAALGGLEATSIYIPLATLQGEEGARYETQVWAANQGTVERRFSTYFIASGQDGTVRVEEEVVPSFAVNPLAGLLVKSSTGSWDRGLLEIAGAPQLVFSAFLVGDDDPLGTAIPVISSTNVFAPDSVAHLQGWALDESRFTAFGLVNLAHEPSLCTVNVFRADGSWIGERSYLVSLQPLSHVQFDNALGTIGEEALSGARAEVSCEGPYYPYAIAFHRQEGRAAIIAPSAVLGDSELLQPGEEPPVPPEPECETCFVEPGVFHVPTSANRVKRLAFPVPPGVYTKIHMKMEILHGGWAPERPSGVHNIFWMARDRNRDLIGYVNVKGPDAYSMFLRHGIGLTQDRKPRVDAGLGLVPGYTYSFEYLYDTAQHVIELVVRNANEEQLAVLRSAPNVNAIEIAQGQTILMDFGFTGENSNEPPTFGWRYQNLSIEILP